MSIRKRRPSARWALPALAATALLLAGCGGGAAAHPSPHAASSTPHASSSAKPSATSAADDVDDDFDDDVDDDDDLDDDGDDDFDDDDDLKDDDDPDFKADDDFKDDDPDLKDDDPDLKDDDRGDALAPGCLALPDELEDLLDDGFTVPIDDVAGMASDDGLGYYLAVRLDDASMVILYTDDDPRRTPFTADVYSVDELARSLSTFPASEDDLLDDPVATRIVGCL
ncbi:MULTISPECIES: hypothetical protein [unclassified Microbacterium]|uniref:hypothetical protein n=1 Tax=unclassified Microbacterium TaxID=2609290 RepID=UPI00300FFE01